MQIGDFHVEQLSEGFFELFEDGSFSKMDPSRLKDPEGDSALGKYSSALGIDPLLIRRNQTNIIVDPGLGWGLDKNSRYHNTSNVITNLDIFGLKREDISMVLLSHLHFDHVAGATFVSKDSKTTPTFPNAEYLVHRDEWEFALQQIGKEQEHPGAGYNLDEFYKLVAEKRIRFIEKEVSEPVPGLTFIKTGGHTAGHMAVKLKSTNAAAYYLGDLIPTEYHLNHYPMKFIDYDSIQAKKAKMLLLKQAFKEQATMFFYHSLYKKSGKLIQDKHKKYVLIDP